ncbi:membrane-spanning 4-domains subfamily A member 4A-like isoform X2 [Cheilinus undulatus]|uniref:membrane-spanning 4-domains subfamily A member 4A-like isoform X2 n=1 Tax=Cheilinus undulatus TaxID=241271 RepID=UPI001BD6386F|nr:membrane-spanning 4-domains subfamily A member 4A-like isoform X2 [Cheilinus undulatus]
MSSTATTISGGMVVVTQVYPSHRPQEGQRVCLGTQRFIEGYPLAIGTVQIMIGALVLLSGIPMVIRANTIGVYSGFFVWGAGFYLTSGSLTVAAGKSLSRCLVNTAMGFNVVSSVAAVTAIILYSFDVAGVITYCWDDNCGPYMVLSQGFSGVLVVFHVLEFAVSLTASIFACRATCNCCDNQQQASVYVSPAVAAQGPPPLHTAPATMAVPGQEIPSFPKPTENQDQIILGLTESQACTC